MNPLAEIVDEFTPKQTVLELLSLSDHNPDSRNEEVKDAAAYMLMPLGTYIRRDNGFSPATLTLEWDKDTTKLEFQQFNESCSFEWATSEIHERVNEIVEEAKPEKVYIVVGENNADRDVMEVYENRSVAEINKTEIEEDYGIPVRIEERPLREK